MLRALLIFKNHSAALQNPDLALPAKLDHAERPEELTS